MSDEVPPPGVADGQLSRVLSSLEAGGNRRSPLYRWLHERHDALASGFERRRTEGLGGPNWAALVAEFAALGLTDGTGKAPTLRGAQQTWYRVVRDVERARSERHTRDPVPVPRPALEDMAQGERLGAGRVVSPSPSSPSDLYPPSPKIDMPRPKPVIDLGPAIPKSPRKEGS